MFNNEQKEIIKWFKKLKEMDYLIIDTETTGLTNNDEIIEIGIINNDGKTIYDKRFKPMKSISFGAYNTHGISEEMLKNCKDFNLYYKQIRDILEDDIIIGYSCYFDWDMVKNTIKNRNLELFNYYKIFDVMREYAKFNQEWNDYRNNWKWQKLIVACSQMGITVKDEHTAIGDCHLTLELIRKIQNIDIDG